MTAPQWGDLVRGMDPAYTGHRPRVQLFHGDADAIINYKNFGEAIKEWTNVLGLATNPTSTTTGLTLGTHQATRQQWKNSCGYVVLDAFTSLGGDHGPSDTLFNSTYVVPFLGLDQTGDVDPEIAACGGGSGGTTGAGGASGSGGTGGRRRGRRCGRGRLWIRWRQRNGGTERIRRRHRRGSGWRGWRRRDRRKSGELAARPREPTADRDRRDAPVLSANSNRGSNPAPASLAH